MAGRFLKVGGVAAAAAAGFYLYRAGGDPKVAEKQFERDAAKLSSKARNELPGKGQEAKNEIKLNAEKAGAQLDSALDRARQETNKVDAKLEAYRKDASQKLGEYTNSAGKDINKAIDTFDKKVEEGAAKSKGYISSWFGGK